MQWLRFLLVILLVFSWNCTNPTPDPEDVVVARVGNQTITVRDFRRNYEFGFPHLKTGENPKLTYLNHMIDEKVLSLEGYRLDFDNSEYVKRLEKDLFDELLIEELFNQQVAKEIKVTPEEIRQAITKSQVSWKLGYWFEPNLSFANSVHGAMKARGFNAVMNDILNSNPEIKLDPSKFETDYISWLEISDELLEVVQDLPIGDVSEPIEIDGKFFIFQVKDIRREPLSEYDFADKREAFRQILYYRRLDKAANEYVNQFMAPKNLATKGKGLTLLANALAAWQGNKKGMLFFEAVENADEKQKSFFELKQNLSEILCTFKDDHWTLGDFISRFDAKDVKATPVDRELFIKELNDQIALEVRNHFLIQEAKNNKLNKSPIVKQQLKEWRDKWVYEQTRNTITKNLKVTKEQVSDYFDKNRDKYKIRWDDEPELEEFANKAKRDYYILRSKAMMKEKIAALQSDTTIKINHTVLDTINVVNFEKSKWATMLVYKRSSNRMAVPIIDPAWGL